jgi:formyltetrahydrofolate deformylase
MPMRWMATISCASKSRPTRSRCHLRRFVSALRPIATDLRMDWRINDSAIKKRVVIMVSKQEHCLYDLLARWQANELNIDIACVISNHDTFKGFVEWHGIPFHHVPVTPDNKAAAYAEVHRLFEEARRHHGACALHADSVTRVVRCVCRAHHQYPSQLFAFLRWGQALPSSLYARREADRRHLPLCHRSAGSGPIIEQDVIRIDHSDSVEDMVRYGKDIEKTVLARGLRYHLEDRVLVHGNKTVVFR